MQDRNLDETYHRTSSNHPILEAKNNYKYMLRQKSFVDESLFGSTSRPQTATNTSNHHLSHNLMSNLAPLIVTSPFRSEHNPDSHPNSSRSQVENNSIKENTQNKQIKTSKPWRP
jgi:hypothetical protein